MSIFRPLFPLGILGALSAVASSAVAVDTSQWKCESCPFEKAGTSGTVDIGAGYVTGDSAKFGDYTGLNQKGGYLIADGDVSYRGDGGLYGNVRAHNLGLDSRSLAAEVGQEGLYTLNVGYVEIPHDLSDTARTPFLGAGSGQLSLPAGFPAPSTAGMPLASTLQPVDLGFKRTRTDGGVSFDLGQDWSVGFNLRRDRRDGTQLMGGSFFSTASQLVAPVDQVTDQLELSTAYSSHRLQATLAYELSLFHNNTDSLTWANPFTPLVNGGNTGQLALAPDNKFQQIIATAGYDISSHFRASGELAIGQMTQDAGFLAPTLNPDLAATLPALPAQSLHGRVNTSHVSLRLSAVPLDALRVNMAFTRDARDNRTRSQSYPAVETDTFPGSFLGLPSAVNQPFSFTQERLKIDADYSGLGALRPSAGVEENRIQRTLQDVATTLESTVWGKINLRAREDLSLSLKVAHAARTQSAYSVPTWVDPPENPIASNFNMADRLRDTVGLRADFTAAQNVTLGLAADLAADNYEHSSIGLNKDHNADLSVDLAVAISDQTQFLLFAETEYSWASQMGSQVFAQPDWSGSNKDSVDMVGLGLKHVMLNNKLKLSADLTMSRSRSDVLVDAMVASPPFPTATTWLASLRLQANYQLRDNLSLIGNFWHENYDANDWRLADLSPSTVPNLLAFGMQPPHYHFSVLQVALRYRF